MIAFEINKGCMLKLTFNHFRVFFETPLLHFNRLFIEKLHCNQENAEFLEYHMTYFYQEFLLLYFFLLFFQSGPKKFIIK